MIKPAQPEHLQKINNIYNQAVKDGLRTAHIDPITLSEREIWLKQHPENLYPVFVFGEGEELYGWVSLSPYREGREALDSVVEVSIYVDYEHHGEGIGTQLMEYAIEYCRDSDFRIMVGILISGNQASINLLEKLGFREFGRLKNAVQYDGKTEDHLYMSKYLF